MTRRPLRYGSLFSGFGGLDLGLDRAGLIPAFQVEIDPYARRVLAKHWPSVPRFDDVRQVTRSRLPRCDLLAGGFPCQDLSDAARGRGDGLDGPRSGLWCEFDRLIGELNPRYVLVENVDGAAWRRWVPFVRCDLYARGFASVPFRVRAEDLGAPFKGSRIFVIAKAHGEGQPTGTVHAQMALLSKSPGPCRKDWGKPSPGALGLADGVPAVVEQLRGFGNAVVPAAAEFVGRLLLSLDALP